MYFLPILALFLDCYKNPTKNKPKNLQNLTENPKLQKSLQNWKNDATQMFSIVFRLSESEGRFCGSIKVISFSNQSLSFLDGDILISLI